MNVRRLAQAPDDPAVIDERGATSWASLEDAVQRCARLLRGAGAGPAGRVGWMLPNRVEALVVALAARRIGAPVVAVSYRSVVAELRALMRVAAPVVIVADNATVPVLLAAGSLPAVVNVDHLPPDSSAPVPMTAPYTVPDRLGAGASLLFTSGTTGPPRAALRIKGDRRLAEVIADSFRIGRDTRFLVAGPLYHSGPWTCALMTLARGGMVGLRPRFVADDWLDFAVTHQMNAGFLTPTQLRRLVDAAPLARLLPVLSDVILSGEPFPAELKKRALEIFGPGFIECYGCTELGPLTALPAQDFVAHSGSSGRPFPGVQVAAFDRARQLQPGAVGMLHARTPIAFEGYLGDDQSPQPHAGTDGWKEVGDVGFVSSDGHVHVLGRSDDVIISGGVNIHPADVEAVLGAHPAVRSCGVFGLPDPRWGEVVAAAVVCRRRLSLAEVRAWMRGRIADDKRPHRLYEVESLPVTPNGKVSRRALRNGFHPASGVISSMRTAPSEPNAAD
ncbi:MAG: acyl--CoA ligase [Actinobacteria bacterium]|nr:acyl--CoA ligase [Actinomycetota bacterium]